MTRIFLRATFVEARRRTEHRLDRKIPAVAVLSRLLHRLCLFRRRGHRGRHGSCRHLLQQPLQHAARFLAAWHTEVEFDLGPRRDGCRVALAQIAALPAVLLRHGREQLALQGAPLGQLHALVDGHGRIVPGRLAVIAVAGQGLRCGIRQVAGQRRDAGFGVQRQQAGKEAVEPGALLHREGRARRG